MKRFFFLFLLYSLSLLPQANSNGWEIDSGKARFKSETEWETIEGTGEGFSGKVNLTTKEILVTMNVSTWVTPNRLQTSHMHDNYLESDKFPEAKFEGKINQIETNTGRVSVSGKLTLHGITKEYKDIIGNWKQTEKGKSQYDTEFSILLSDHKIEIPSLVIIKLNNEIKVKVRLFLKS